MFFCFLIQHGLNNLVDCQLVDALLTSYLHQFCTSLMKGGGFYAVGYQARRFKREYSKLFLKGHLASCFLELKVDQRDWIQPPRLTESQFDNRGCRVEVIQGL